MSETTRRDDHRERSRPSAAEVAANRAFSTVDVRSHRHSNHSSGSHKRRHSSHSHEHRTYNDTFEAHDIRETSEVSEQWKKAALHVLIASAAAFLLAAILLYITKAPMVREAKEHRFDEETVSPRRVAMWAGVSAGCVAVISSILIYSRFRKHVHK